MRYKNSRTAGLKIVFIKHFGRKLIKTAYILFWRNFFKKKTLFTQTLFLHGQKKFIHSYLLFRLKGVVIRKTRRDFSIYRRTSHCDALKTKHLRTYERHGAETTVVRPPPVTFDTRATGCRATQP